jgi:hypothetical protein
MSDATLTLTAAGPAKAVLFDERDDVEIETRVPTEIEATLEIDDVWLAETGHAGVSKHGAYLKRESIAIYVAETASDEETTYVVDDLDEWTFTLSGRPEAWLDVAIPAAKHRVSVGSTDRVANVACHVLDGLSEHAPGNRPQLALLDVLEDHDPKDFSRENVLRALSDGALEPTQPTAETTEAVADD